SVARQRKRGDLLAAACGQRLGIERATQFVRQPTDPAALKWRQYFVGGVWGAGCERGADPRRSTRPVGRVSFEQFNRIGGQVRPAAQSLGVCRTIEEGDAGPA